ncbi:MAG: copper chaperone PCu(A)C [Alphaproteobacteria bacterium]|nr:copper chaperone PCu(A)C [Alphaproteobacteria bacterium]
MLRIVAGLFAAVAVAAPAAAAEGFAVDVSMAWTPPVEKTGQDSPVYMTITNRADEPDNLVRVRCPMDLADFTEKDATDHGEGGTAIREVKSIPIPAKGTASLAPDGYHLRLLHVRQILREGQTFTCSLVFQKAGTIPVEVKVAAAGAK